MDEELYARNVDVSHRSLHSLISEFKAVRASTEQLYQHLTDERQRVIPWFMFDKFIRQQIETQGTIINVVHGGSGFPVLLLNGYPQTHVCWHRVAPILAEQFTVVWSADSWKEFDILEVWKSRAENVQGRAFDCGHFLPEEKPEQTAAELIRFLT
jgi:hypothetical protein